MGLGPLTARLRAGERREPPANGVTAPVGSVVRSVVFVKEKQGGGRTNIPHRGQERREARSQPPRNKVSQGLQQEPSQWEYK